MSKASRKKANKRKKRDRKKSDKESSCSKNEWSKRQLRFVAYMLEDDTRDFSGVLCGMNVDDIIEAKYKTFWFDNIAYVRISLHVHNDNLCRAYGLMESSVLTSVGSKQFISPKCRGLFVHRITEEALCLVGQITHEIVDQFKSDAKESRALYDSELVFYQIPNSINVFVEIYTDDINREFAVAVLDDGWMSDKWGNQFKAIADKGEY